MPSLERLSTRRLSARRLSARLRRGAEGEAEAIAAVPPAMRRRRALVVGGTYVVGAVVMAWALRIPPGDAAFYPATVLLAATWAGGSLLAGGSRWLRARSSRSAGALADGLLGLGVGAALLLVFLLGASFVAPYASIRTPVERLLEHAAFGALPIVTLITVVNGICEEMFFRGALYELSSGRGAVLLSTLLYALVTATSGVGLLVLAAALLGLVVGVLRRVTGTLPAPVLAHLVWSVGMLVFLRPVLDFWE